MSLSDIVSVDISRDTVGVSKESFNVIGILSDECNFVERTRSYATADDAKDDLVGGAYSYTYKMANALKSQSPACKTFKILNRIGPKTILFKGTWTAGGSVSVTVNGTVVTQAYASGKDTDLGTLATSITNLAAINGVTFSASYTNNSTTADTDYLTITPTGGPCCITAVTVTGIIGTMTTALCGLVAPVVITDNTGSFTGGYISTTVNGTKVTTAKVTDKDTTLTAHAAAILANSVLTTQLATVIYANGSHTITIIPAAGYGVTATLDFSSFQGTMTAHVTLQGTEDIATALAAIELYDSAWYGLVWADASSSEATATAPYQTTDTALVANQLKVAVYAEANGKVACLGSSDPRCVTVALADDSTTIAKTLYTAGYARSFIFYSGTADTEFADVAILGKILPFTPGSYTAKFKTLSGITVDSLTSTYITNAIAKNVMYYTSIAGVSITAEGKVAEGEWIDTIVGIDWQTNLIQTYVYQLMVSSKKVPFDDSGITAVVSKVSQALEAGINSGLYTPHQRDDDGNVIGGYVVTAPKSVDISANDKNNRTLNDVLFTAYLAGAIHSATISGIVTV